jgi:hydroxymethylpyrimidine pyrophosphatase-like HAD family hydrolase
MKKIICFDLDNTLCVTEESHYKNSKPIKKNIKFINFLKRKGFYIKIFTA